MFNFSYYTGTSLVGAHRFGVLFPKLQTFPEIFWALTIEYSLYEKQYSEFLFIYLLRSYNDKSKFPFLQTVQSSCNTSANEPFLRKMLALHFSSNFALYIEKKIHAKIMKGSGHET